MASVTVLLNDPMQRGNDSEEARARILAALKTVDEARATGKSKIFSNKGFSPGVEKYMWIVCKIVSMQCGKCGQPAGCYSESACPWSEVGFRAAA